MATINSSSYLILLLLILPIYCHSFSFNFSSFRCDGEEIDCEGDAVVFPSSNLTVIDLTKSRVNSDLSSSVGRASYKKPVRVWDRKTRALTDFTTRFSFSIEATNNLTYGDGLAFFMAPFNSTTIPINSAGGYLGIFSADSALNKSSNKVIAVEFDTFKNEWDPDDNHVGIDLNSIVSKQNVTWKSSIRNGSIANAWVSYDSKTQNLSVFLTYAKNPVFGGNSSLWTIVDLRESLTELVTIGFSASTGSAVETHRVLSWSFDSTLEVGDNRKKSYVGLAVGLVLGFVVLACLASLIWFFIRRKRQSEEDEAFGVFEMNDEFEKGIGPKGFTYRELARSTNNFSDSGKLGEGGFGSVFKGVLRSSNVEIAVKRVSRGSKQGKKEYISEVRIISRLRHRNLVQLIGWCHEKGELLLVYEFMPNSSLDSHLFGQKPTLSWNIRYKIALGLANALLYLHEEWEQCVLHRDIKSSNIMLDSEFNAKLGDFGLARLVDHNLGAQTTDLAGTLVYMAPECIITGKASKESDVYSFGMVALEIACGRRPVEASPEPSKIRLVEWVWSLYGSGKILEAADRRLSHEEIDENEIESLTIVGLWCCHPDYNRRPSIRQVINALNFEGPLPTLPPELPVPVYSHYSFSTSSFNTGSSAFTTGSSTAKTQSLS